MIKRGYFELPVIAVDKVTGITIGHYKSITEAANKLDCQPSHISECCFGKRHAHKDMYFMTEIDYREAHQ